MKYNNLLIGMLSLSMTSVLWLSGPSAAANEAFVLPYQRMQAYAHTDEEGFAGTSISWSAGPVERRSVHLIDNTKVDPSGHFGGYARTIRYPANGRTRVCAGSNPDYPGFGMVVNHVEGGSFNSVRQQGIGSQLLLAGDNHAIYAYKWRYNIGGVPVEITVHWLFVTGQRSPVYAITFDTSACAADALMADTRAPYGDIDWDGGVHAPIEGVAWGDHKQFHTLGRGPVSLQSGWDYTRDNVVPYARSYTRTADAEMGLVQTQTQTQHSAGGYSGSAAWGTSSPQGPMPDQSNWPYQLHQWQLPDDPAAKRIAWGSNYGAVGQRWYPTLGELTHANGYPYQSYSVFIVTDTHQAHPVQRQVKEVAAQQAATLSGVENANVRLSGPGGVGRDDDVRYDVAGLNPIYSTWEVEKSGSGERLSFVLQPAPQQAITRPTFVIHGVSHAPRGGVIVDGVLQRSQQGYFLSEDPDHDKVWITLASDVTHATQITLQGI